MSIHWWPASTETDAGENADGRSLYIEMFGLVLEICMMRVRRGRR